MRLAALWCITSAVTLAALLATLPRAIGARSNAAAHALQVRQVDSLIRRIALRKSSSPAWAEAEVAGGSLPERLASAVASAGLRAEVLATVAPGGDEPVAAEPSLRRQRASVALEGLTLPQFASFLAEWRRAEPAWVTTGIELAPEFSKSPEPGSDLPLRATLTLERLTPVDQP
jgi:hypothetical protein